MAAAIVTVSTVGHASGDAAQLNHTTHAQIFYQSPRPCACDAAVRPRLLDGRSTRDRSSGDQQDAEGEEDASLLAGQPGRMYARSLSIAPAVVLVSPPRLPRRTSSVSSERGPSRSPRSPPGSRARTRARAAAAPTQRGAGPRRPAACQIDALAHLRHPKVLGVEHRVLDLEAHVRQLVEQLAPARRRWSGSSTRSRAPRASPRWPRSRRAPSGRSRCSCARGARAGCSCEGWHGNPATSASHLGHAASASPSGGASESCRSSTAAAG